MKIVLGALLFLLLLGALEVPFAGHHGTGDDSTRGGCTSSSFFLRTVK